MHQIQHVRREVVGQAADNNEPIGMHECLCRSNARSGGGAGAGLTLRLVSKVLFWTTFYIIIVIGGFCVGPKFRCSDVAFPLNKNVVFWPVG